MSADATRARNPFSKGVVLLVLVVGAFAFLLMLYALGQGWTGQSERDGGSHARSNGLNGLAGLVQLLENSGQEVEISRSRSALDDYGLLVLTPPLNADPAQVAEAIDERRESGIVPTLVILPKWWAYPVP